jgi:signal transduction histidine kinase
MSGLSLRTVPFRLRLTLGFAAMMVVLFGSLALLLHTLFSASLDDGINRSLHTHADDLQTLVSGSRRLPELPETGGAFAQILDPVTGRVRDATLGHNKPLLSADQVRRAAAAPLFVARQGKARLLARPVSTRPRSVLVVGASLSERDNALRTLDELLFIGGPVMLALTCLAGYGLAERALAPVERMRARAAQISGAPRGDRLPVPEANDELHRLGDTLNAMLSRVEDALERESAFVADAGHELRTPLSILKLELELALSAESSREELETRLRSAAEEVDRLARLAQDLLVIARAKRGPLPLKKDRLEVRHVLEDLAGRFATPLSGQGRAVAVEDADGLSVRADRLRLEQALTNIVSNALQHGEGAVVLSAAKRNGSVELHVLDEGGGFDPDFLPRAFERFTHSDSSRSRGSVGLGLSIVQVIAEAHGGHASAANRAGGGADVWLSLPTA